MNINNELNSPPDAVRQVFYNYVPFGSDYVIYCSGYSAASREYTLLYRQVGEKTLSKVVASSSGNNNYSFTETDLSTEYDGFTVSNPYYAFSSEKGAGKYEELPSVRSLSCLMLVVIASLCVLKVVFGGIKLWSNKRKSSVYA